MLSEIIRSGLNSIDKGANGGSSVIRIKLYPNIKVYSLPHAFEEWCRQLSANLFHLLKDTSLAVVIALPELTHNAQIIYGQKAGYVIPMLLVLALMYFTVNFFLSMVARRMEVKHV